MEGDSLPHPDEGKGLKSDHAFPTSWHERPRSSEALRPSSISRPALSCSTCSGVINEKLMGAGFSAGGMHGSCTLGLPTEPCCSSACSGLSSTDPSTELSKESHSSIAGFSIGASAGGGSISVKGGANDSDAVLFVLVKESGEMWRQSGDKDRSDGRAPESKDVERMPPPP